MSKALTRLQLAQQEFDDILDLIRDVRVKSLALSKKVHGAHLSIKGVNTCLNNLAAEIKWAQPLADCPNAYSGGVHPITCRCMGSGMIPTSQKNG